MTRISNLRLADENHAVVTVEDDRTTRRLYRREPCQTCPWRKDAVGEFPANAFRLSAKTGTLAENLTQLDNPNTAMRMFGCHSSGTGKPATCAGYILNGDAAIGWRVAHSRGRFDPDECHSEVELFDSYYEMAVANGVPPDDPAIAVCRKPTPSSFRKPGTQRSEAAGQKSRRPPRVRRRSQQSAGQ